MLTSEKIWKQYEAMDIVSSPKVARTLLKPSDLLWEKLWFARSLYPHLPQMGQYFYYDMSLSFNDIMPSFMIFRRVLDIQELKNQVSHSFRASHDAQMFEFHSHPLHGT